MIGAMVEAAGTGGGRQPGEAVNQLALEAMRIGMTKMSAIAMPAGRDVAKLDRGCMQGAAVDVATLPLRERHTCMRNDAMTGERVRWADNVAEEVDTGIDAMQSDVGLERQAQFTLQKLRDGLLPTLEL